MKLSTRLAVAARTARLRRPSPLGALFKGFLAGMAGSLAQDLFFAATAKRMPEPTKVTPKEGGKPDGGGENNLETVARRLNDGLLLRPPLDESGKKRAGKVIHYLFGGAWGALYGLLRETTRHVPPQAFGIGVWLLADNLLLPAMRLAAWPQKYSRAEHFYALQAHLAYGGATAATYQLIREVGVVPLAAIPALLALRARAFAHSMPPGRILQSRKPAMVRWFEQRADRAFAQ